MARRISWMGQSMCQIGDYGVGLFPSYLARCLAWSYRHIFRPCMVPNGTDLMEPFGSDTLQEVNSLQMHLCRVGVIRWHGLGPARWNALQISEEPMNCDFNPQNPLVSHQMKNTSACIHYLGRVLLQTGVARIFWRGHTSEPHIGICWICVWSIWVRKCNRDSWFKRFWCKVHIIYRLSEDPCNSSCWVRVFYSHNEAVLAALTGGTGFCSISTGT